MNISGCDFLSIGHVLLADCIGEKQLMQHNSDGKHVKDIQLSNEPYDLTTIDSQHIAVTYGVEGYIEIINIITDEVETVENLQTHFGTPISFSPQTYNK
jgi:hypothetical protein